MKKLVVGVLVASVLLQPLGLVAPVFAEEVRMEYPAPTDPDPKHIHAPKVVNGVAYEYDANGNLTYDGERRITWNQDNLPTKIEKDGKVVEFFYDAGGRRILKRSGQDKVVYVSSSYEQLTINNQQSSTKYYFANGRVAVRNTPSGGGSTLTYLHQDHLGSTVLATDSESQKITDPLSYFPYGSSMNNEQLTMSNHLFTGQEKDPESDLYNYNARLYNSTTGAFVSADSVGGGNRYAYAANNPMVYVDPSGNNPLAALLHLVSQITYRVGIIGKSFSSGTFWAGVATWAGGVYAEAYTKYVQDQGFMPPLTPYEVGWYEPTPVDLSEEEYEQRMDSANALQEVGKGIATLGIVGYTASELMYEFGRTTLSLSEATDLTTIKAMQDPASGDVKVHMQNSALDKYKIQPGDLVPGTAGYQERGAAYTAAVADDVSVVKEIFPTANIQGTTAMFGAFPEEDLVAAGVVERVEPVGKIENAVLGAFQWFSRLQYQLTRYGTVPSFPNSRRFIIQEPR